MHGYLLVFFIFHISHLIAFIIIKYHIKIKKCFEFIMKQKSKITNLMILTEVDNFYHSFKTLGYFILKVLSYFT